VICTPASDLYSSSARWVDEATPEEPNVRASGFALARAVSSWTFLTPSSGVTTSTVGVEVIKVMKAKSL
jgi:hypothetical protein